MALQHLADPVAKFVGDRETPPAGALAGLTGVHPDLPLCRHEQARAVEVVSLRHAQPEQILGDGLDRHRDQVSAEGLPVALEQDAGARGSVTGQDMAEL